MAGTARHIWWTRKAVFLHCILAVCVPGFIALFWWQVQRVREGNGLSWAYVFEWPFFTGYAIYLWWKLVHDQGQEGEAPSAMPAPAAGDHHPMPVTGVDPAPTASVPSAPPSVEDEDEELAAYNRYLAELNASDRPKRW